MTSRVAFVLAVLLALAAVYMFLWILSSADMAFAYCRGAFSFSAELPRCRTPLIAATAFVIVFISAVAMLLLGLSLRRGKKPKKDAR
jgi:multisubunit Na+/H+ antiporter MnhB subunit